MKESSHMVTERIYPTRPGAPMEAAWREHFVTDKLVRYRGHGRAGTCELTDASLWFIGG